MCLLADHADIDERPQNHAWAQFVERLEIQRADGRVELAPDKELVCRQLQQY